MRIKLLITGVLAGFSSSLLFWGLVQAQAPPSIERGDIYRVRNITKNTDFRDPVSAEPCDELQYKLRLHNPGPTEVARNVSVQVVFPSTVTSQHISTATVKSANIFPTSVSDAATVNLSSLQRVTYVPGSSQLLDDNSNFLRSLPDVTSGSGAVVGDIGVSVREKRFVQFKAKVDCPKPPVKPKESMGECKVLNLEITDKKNREVRATLQGEVQNAAITGYSINFGGGTVVNQQAATHRYGQPGTYTVIGTVTVRLADGTTLNRTSDNCKKQVTFEKEQPPVTPPAPVTPAEAPRPPAPEVLPVTGIANIAGVFTLVTSVSGVTYYLIGRRF